MNYTEFKRLLKRSGWKVNEFAASFGLAQRSLSNYGRDDKKVPQTWGIVAVLLDEMVKSGVPKQRILDRINEMQPKPQCRKPRGSRRGLRCADANAATAISTIELDEGK